MSVVARLRNPAADKVYITQNTFNSSYLQSGLRMLSNVTQKYKLKIFIKNSTFSWKTSEKFNKTNKGLTMTMPTYT